MQKASGRVSLSLPLRGFFSPFPHGTSPLSVITQYLGLEGGPPGFGRGFTCPVLLGIPVGPGWAFGYGAFTPCGRTFQSVRLACPVPCPGPATPECKHSGLA